MKKSPLPISLLLLLAPIFVFSADYYWVGGNGNWSDIGHWATTSGGTTFHNQAPTSEDNVLFDANSFTAAGQTVTINSDNAFCQNMTWVGATGTPTLTSTSEQILNINGSLLLIPDMVFDFAGDINFLSQEIGQQIDLAGHQLARNVLFSGANGEWILQSDLVVDSMITLKNGTLNTNDQPLECAYLYVMPINASKLQLGNSSIMITGSTFFIDYIKYPVVFITRNGFTLESGMSSIEFPADDVDMIVEGDGPVLPFHNALFSDPMGDVYLQVRQPGQLSFDSLLFKNSAKILGTMQFDYLELAPGKGYSFESNITYTIGELQAPGQCEAPIQILGSSAGEAVTFNSNSGPINVSYVSIQDIHATGGADFTTNNSANLGNNDGWTINSSSMTDLYWVGGTGNWDDPMHWSFSSGGAGGACVPTGADNVYFDASSFTAPGQTVIINLDNALCRNMDWTGATGTPILAGTIMENLRIFGSLTFIPDMQLQVGGDIYLQSSQPGNTVTTGNHLFTRSIIFDGNGGEWSLQDSLKAIREVIFVKGHLMTNDQIVLAHSLRSEHPHNRQLTLGNSHIYMRDHNYDDDLYWPSFRLEANNLTFDAGTSTIEYLTYGEHVTSGAGAIDYHKVIFDAYGVVSSWDELDVYIDSLIHHESSIYYGAGFHIGSWQLDGGYEYQLDLNKEYNIDQLDLNSECNGLVYVHSRINGIPSSVKSDNILTGEYLLLKDVINSGTNDFIANNSVDLGNNQNITINELTSRTLYWVGEDGLWSDPAHWSLTSGGPGGECIPTPLDDVFFDQNSFTIDGRGVFGSIFPQNYCRNITWRDATNNPQFYLGDLLVFGSLEFNENMVVGLGSIRFSSKDAGNTINTKGIYVNYANFEGSGSWELIDSYNGFGVNLSGGTWNTNGFPVELTYLHSFDMEIQKTLILEDSYITINGSIDNVGSYPWFFSTNIQIDPGTSTIEFTSPNASMAMHHDESQLYNFHNILFSAEEGTALMDANYGTNLTINRLDFISNGIINSGNTIDSLIFTGGKSYQLEVDKTQTLKEYWQIIGNNCLSIELSSTIPGQKSTVSMASGQVDGDFIQMRDQIATGGANFYAGTHSTDIGSSNTGWIFDSAEDFVEVGFLGEDLVLCKNTTITLDADNKSPNETYLWSDGTTSDSLNVTGSGTFWAEVSFTDACTIRDSVLVFDQDDFSIDLGPNTALCDGDTLVLDATVNALGIQYLWHDDTTEPLYTVTSAGEYKVELELSGCTFRDSIEINYKPLPSFDLGQNPTICDGDIALLGAEINPLATYLWNNGSSEATLNARDAGIYWQEVTIDGCSLRDSLTLITKNSPVIDMGADQELCDGESQTLDATNAGATYLWQDGSTASTLLVNTSGEYLVNVDLDGCLRSDTVSFNFKPLPIFELGDDQSACEGQSVSLDGTVPGATYNWNEGSTSPVITIGTDGEYRLIATLNGCDYRDSLNVNFKPNPVINLGADQELCDGESQTLDATNASATYLWQDGSTASTLLVNTSGEYLVNVDLDGCLRSDTVSFNFKPLPVFDLGDDLSPCENETVVLDGTSPNATYLWSDGTVNPLLSIMSSGLYWMEATLEGCSKRDSVSVDYIVLPKMVLGADQTLCEGESAALDATFSGANYLWQDGSTSSGFIVNQEGEYWVSIQVGSCEERDSMVATFNPTPVFDLGSNLVLCEGESQTFTLSSEADTYLWQNGSTSSSFATAFPGGLVWGEVSQDGCVFRDSIQVDYRQLPILNLGPDTLICEGEPYRLDISNTKGQISWQDGSNAEVYEVTAQGTYSVEVSDGPCVATDDVVINTRECIYFELYMPNAFSPNEDGENDEISPYVAPGVQILQYTFTIFDRWGNQIFQTNNPDDSWDGDWNGQKLPAGVYIYYLDLEYMDERGTGTEIFSGDVTLIK